MIKDFGTQTISSSPACRWGPTQIRLGGGGTCGVLDVSVGLRSAAGLRPDAHVLPLGQRALGGKVARYVRRNDGFVWAE